MRSQTPLLGVSRLSSSPPAGSSEVSALSASSGSLKEWDEEGRGGQDVTQVDATSTTQVLFIIHKVAMCITFLDISTLEGSLLLMFI